MEEQFAVRKVFYDIHRKKGAKVDSPPSLRVRYICVGGDRCVSFREWVCFEHIGYPREKAQRWWKLRSSLAVPSSVLEACRIASEGLLREPIAIVVERKGDSDFYDVIDYIFAP